MPLPKKDRNSFLQELHILLTDVKQLAHAFIAVSLVILCVQQRLPVSDLVDLLICSQGRGKFAEVPKCPTLPPALPSQFLKTLMGWSCCNVS